MNDSFKHHFHQLAQIGALPEGGVSRLAFTPEDKLARSWLMQRMVEAGLSVSTDAAGNIIGRRRGQKELAPVMTGSHIDTVPQGGNYDGAVGVLAGLEVIRRFNRENIQTKRPIDIICFSAEESSRFGMATIGSKAFTGNIDAEKARSLKDREGVSLYRALTEAGCTPDDLGHHPTLPVHAFIELHIEQGPVLEACHCPIGVVTSIAAPTRFKVILKGRSDHSGSTPMNMRRDALAGVSELILGVERIASREAGKNTVGTAGYAWAMPGSMNVIPGRVEVGIDIRDINRDDKEKAVKAIKSLMGDIAQKRGLTVSCDQLCHEEPVALSGKMVHLLEKAAHACKLESMRLPSGAGHDAMNMAKITDTGLIFIPSLGGISHNSAEYTPDQDIEAGIKVLHKTLLHLAQE